jgi:hypothetical protein
MPLTTRRTMRKRPAAGTTPTAGHNVTGPALYSESRLMYLMSTASSLPLG